MKIKSEKIYSQIVKLTRTVIFLLLFTILIFISFLNYQEYKKASPYDVVVSDIKPNSVNISWKTQYQVPTYIKLFEKEKLFGDGVSSSFHQVHVNLLKELTEYQFEITDGSRSWKKIILPNTKKLRNISKSDLYFITTKTKEDIPLPNIIEINSNPNELIYVFLHNILGGMDSKVKSIRTNQFGNTLVDKNFFDVNWKDGEYIVNIYPAMSSDLNISKYISAYASEINCNQLAPKQTIDGVTREQFANYATRWVNGRGKNYAYECFNDVVYRSRLAGVDPAFSLAVWLNESSASNYTQNLKQYGFIEDFGIHGLSSVPPQNFNAQITHFLEMSHRSSCPGLSNWESWGNIYRFGTCNSNNLEQRNSGIDYYIKTENLYKWITNGRKLPTVVTGLPIPVDIGNDLGNWSPLAKPVCCIPKISKQDKLIGLYNSDVLEYSCEEIWSSNDSNIQNTERYIEIENIDKKDCELEFSSACCRVGNEILWYPTKYCPYVIKGVDTSLKCEEYNQEKACFYRGERFKWLPKGIGEDYVTNINNEVQCNLRNDVSSHTIKLKKGINFIGFDFTPSYNNDVLYASRLLSLYPQISLIANFYDNDWNQLIAHSKTNPFLGEDFFFEQSKGYLLILDEEIDITIYGWKDIQSTTPELISGWNFVLRDSINDEANTKIFANDVIERVAVWSEETKALTYHIDNGLEDVLGVNSQESKYQAVFILKKQ